MSFSNACIFAVFIDVIPKQSEHSAGESTAECSVLCYAPGLDEDDALRRLESDLANRNLRLTNVQWVYDHGPFPSADIADDGYLRKARRTDRVVYDDSNERRGPNTTR